MVPTCLNDFKDLADDSQGLFNCRPQKTRRQLMTSEAGFHSCVSENTVLVYLGMIYFTYDVNMIHPNCSQRYCQGWLQIGFLAVFCTRPWPCLLFKLVFHATTNSRLGMIQARNSNFIYMMSCVEGRLVKEMQNWNGQWIKSKLFFPRDISSGVCQKPSPEAQREADNINYSAGSLSIFREVRTMLRKRMSRDNTIQLNDTEHTSFSRHVTTFKKAFSRQYFIGQNQCRQFKSSA